MALLIFSYLLWEEIALINSLKAVITPFELTCVFGFNFSCVFGGLNLPLDHL